MKRIHYHSDLNYFGGCENMIVNFLNSKTMADEYEMTFSHRASSKYHEGLTNRLRSNVKTYPLRLPLLSINNKLTSIIKFFKFK